MEKNKIMMIVIILLLVVLLGTIGAVSFILLRNLGKDPEEATPPPPVEISLENTANFSAGEIRCNLLPVTPGGPTYMAIGIFSFLIDSERDTKGTLLALLEDKVDIVRDIINSILWNTTIEDIRVTNGQEHLKEKILNQVNEVFNTNLVIQCNLSSWTTSVTTN